MCSDLVIEIVKKIGPPLTFLNRSPFFIGCSSCFRHRIHCESCRSSCNAKFWHIQNCHPKDTHRPKYNHFGNDPNLTLWRETFESWSSCFHHLSILFLLPFPNRCRNCQPHDTRILQDLRTVTKVSTENNRLRSLWLLAFLLAFVADVATLVSAATMIEIIIAIIETMLIIFNWIRTFFICKLILNCLRDFGFFRTVEKNSTDWQCDEPDRNACNQWQKEKPSCKT